VIDSKLFIVSIISLGIQHLCRFLT